MSRALAAEAAGLNVLVLVSPKRECARLARCLTAGLPHSCVVSASRMEEAVSALKTRRMHAVVCDLRFFPKMYAAVARQSAGPQNEAELGGHSPTEDEVPFYCLLEDDNLIDKVSLETDVLLEPTSQDVDPNDSRLIITVTIRPSVVIQPNLKFV